MTAKLPTAVINKNINIIGAGASGLYTCYKLLQLNSKEHSSLNIKLNINIWDKLPVPFGLVRNGVAPDHPEIKNCIDTFKEMFNNKEDKKNTVKFIGNCNLTKEEEYKELLAKSDLVFLATGCEKSRGYRLENKSEENTLTAKELVDWYNSYPYSGKEPSSRWRTMDFWKNIRHVNIIGNGNVAFDLCRLFAKCKHNKEEIDKTDINSNFVEIMSKTPFEKINIIGRRDFSHAKFGTKEFRELWALSKYGVQGEVNSRYLPQTEEGKKLPRALAKRAQIAIKNMEEQQKIGAEASMKWELKFLQSPFKIDEKEKLLYSRENEIDSSTLRITPTQKVEKIQNDLVILSIGTENKENDFYAELELNNPNKVKCVGWLRTNGSGSIAETMMDTFPLVEREFKNIDFLDNKNSNEVGDYEFARSRLPELTYWNHYLALEEYEQTNKNGKKCQSASEILEVVHKIPAK